MGRINTIDARIRKNRLAVAGCPCEGRLDTTKAMRLADGIVPDSRRIGARAKPGRLFRHILFLSLLRDREGWGLLLFLPITIALYGSKSIIARQRRVLPALPRCFRLLNQITKNGVSGSFF